jgi:3-oxoadipate enol-lactonase
MELIDLGSGPPLVLIPGIQGRWEYLRPAIEALTACFRVLTFPLSGERGGLPFDSASGFDIDSRQVLTALNRCGIDSAIVCGVSFGGLPAIHFAAAHPERTAALILVSTPGPVWQLRPKHRVYARLPWLFGPLFLIESPLRLRREIAAAFPRLLDRWRFAQWQLGALARAPLSPVRMAARARLISSTDIVADCAKVTAPALIVTGEPALDRVVAVDGTLAYRSLIAGARHVMLERTGHLGSITRPGKFASVLQEFVMALANGPEPRNHENSPGLVPAVNQIASAPPPGIPLEEAGH